MAQVLRGAAHERQRTVQERGVLEAVAGEALGGLTQRGDRVGVRVHLHQQLVQLAQVACDREHEELLLGGEVAVDQRAVDAHGAGDLVDRRVLDPALVEEGTRRADDVLLAGPPGVLPCPSYRPSTGHAGDAADAGFTENLDSPA